MTEESRTTDRASGQRRPHPEGATPVGSRGLTVSLTASAAPAPTDVVTASGARIRLARTPDLFALRRARIGSDGRCIV